MTRKDTILIGVVINAGLLAILFTTAVIYDTDKGLEQTEFVTPLADSKAIPPETPSTLIASASTGDEVDNVLKYYSQPSSLPVVMEIQPETYASEPISMRADAADDEDPIQETDLFGQAHIVEVKIKNGDMLEKIARANKTTVGAIKSLNHLTNERLYIGQVLKVPVNSESSTVVLTRSIKNQETRQEQKKEEDSKEPVYYVIKSGDNPWKVAKKFNVKFEDIVRLNQLDEDKARNLKIGDRIRVK